MKMKIKKIIKGEEKRTSNTKEKEKKKHIKVIAIENTWQKVYKHIIVLAKCYPTNRRIVNFLTPFQLSPFCLSWISPTFF